MADRLEDLKTVVHINGYTYSSEEVIGLVSWAVDEIMRLRAALKQIVDEADSDDGLTAWDGSDIARAALNIHKRGEAKS